MEQKRLFIGSLIQNEEILKSYPGIMDNFYHVVKGKWTEQENLHINYKFLGYVQVEKIDEIKEALSGILKEHNSPLKFHGVGSFPNFANPRVLFMHVYSPDRSILSAASEIESKMEALGFPREKRRFKPHLTLCRIKSINTGFEDVVKDYEKLEFTTIPSYSINLIESKLTQNGPIYTVLT